MKFDWSKFTKSDFEKFIEKRNNHIFDCHDYLGAVYVGDICIELLDYGMVNNSNEYLLFYNFYVAHEDTGYGYKDDILPYDYADGECIIVYPDMSYDKFKIKAESFFVSYIKSFEGSYSLIDHAIRPLEIW